jgi:hypothetical protein
MSKQLTGTQKRRAKRNSIALNHSRETTDDNGATVEVPVEVRDDPK